MKFLYCGKMKIFHSASFLSFQVSQANRVNWSLFSEWMNWQTRKCFDSFKERFAFKNSSVSLGAGALGWLGWQAWGERNLFSTHHVNGSRIKKRNGRSNTSQFFPLEEIIASVVVSTFIRRMIICLQTNVIVSRTLDYSLPSLDCQMHWTSRCSARDDCLCGNIDKKNIFQFQWYGEERDFFFSGKFGMLQSSGWMVFGNNRSHNEASVSNAFMKAINSSPFMLLFVVGLFIVSIIYFRYEQLICQHQEEIN